MHLKEFDFTEKTDNKETWKVEGLYLDKKNNLIAGKNSAGKTRTLSFIVNFAKLLKGLFILNKNSYEWNVAFQDGKSKFKYFIKLEDYKVIEETFVENGIELIKRNKNRGKIFSKLRKEYITFNPPEDKLTIAVRRNEEEYPYLEKLLDWAENLYSFSFSGLQMRATSSPAAYEAIFECLDRMTDILEKDLNKKGFKNSIIKDMYKIGYDIKDIDFTSSLFGTSMKIPIVKIKEKGLKLEINQHSMSAGMYRAFSLLVLFNHYLLLKKPCTIMIDDLGEGLDYERASKLTKLLFEKNKGSSIQLIVSSNDRFLMNAIDLKYWNILERNDHIVTSYNYQNSKVKFKDFVFTGLNNFDFFVSEFYKENQ